MQSTKTTPAPEVIFTHFEDQEGILVDLNTKQYYRLNETGALVWKGLEGGRTVDDIVAELQNNYDVGSEHATASVTRLLRELETNKLVKTE